MIMIHAKLNKLKIITHNMWDIRNPVHQTRNKELTCGRDSRMKTLVVYELLHNKSIKMINK